MTENLKDFVDHYVKLSDAEMEAFINASTIKKIRKKELLVKEGEACTFIGFFTEGYFRFYYSDSNGNEVTTDFHFAPGFITSFTSFLTQSPSRTNVQAMEDMDIIQISKAKLYDLYNKHHIIERLGRIMAEHVFITSETHLLMILSQTAETRYRILLDKYPNFVNSIPLQYIASYLGITQETLSRMRKAIH